MTYPPPDDPYTVPPDPYGGRPNQPPPQKYMMVPAYQPVMLVKPPVSRLNAGLLQMLLPLVGVPGVGRLYSRHLTIGLIQVIGYLATTVLGCCAAGLTLGISLLLPAAFLLWSMADGIYILASDCHDGHGNPMT